MKKILFAAAASVAGLASAAQASGCNSPYCQGGGHFGGHGRGLPTFQAAPWYLYWPYNNHFMTPAPMQGGAYGGYGGHPGGGLTNPYFPGGGYSYPQSTPGSSPYTPPSAMPGSTLPTNPPAPMPQPGGTVPPPSYSPPTGTVPPVTQPQGGTPPAGTTPPVTPGVSIPVIPAVPGLIRASARR